MRIAAKKDGNHDEIKAIFERFGWIVIDTFNSNGTMLDFLAYKVVGPLWFVEVKNGKYAKLTTREKTFFALHPERSVQIHTTEQAIQFLSR